MRHLRRSCRTIHCCDSSNDAVEWVPSEPEGVSEARHHGIDHPVLHYAGYTSAGWACWPRRLAAGRRSQPGQAPPPPIPVTSDSSSTSSSSRRPGLGTASRTEYTPAWAGLQQYGPPATTLRTATAVPRRVWSLGSQTSTTPQADTTDDSTGSDTVSYDVSGGPSDGTVTLSPPTGAFDYTPRQAATPSSANPTRSRTASR